MTARNLFHHEGVTDLTVMRAEAARAAARGERVVLHLHEYVEEWDGCPFNDRHRTLELWEEGHEEFAPEEVAT